MTSDNRSLRATIRDALTARQNGTVTILSALLAVEDAIGYIPSEAIEAVADFTSATVNDVWGVASFYTNFSFTPPEEHIVEVCWGPSCHILNAPAILKEVTHLLEPEAHGAARDNKVTLKYNTCLGACAQAPVIAVDHIHRGRITAGNATTIARELRSP